eukprot:6953434-Karenia_brevis.AAC.1
MDFRYNVDKLSGLQNRHIASEASKTKVVPFGLRVEDHYKLGCGADSPVDSPIVLAEDLKF